MIKNIKTIGELVTQLLRYDQNKRPLVYNGETLCAIEMVAEYNIEDDPDDGSVVIYAEE